MIGFHTDALGACFHSISADSDTVHIISLHTCCQSWPLTLVVLAGPYLAAEIACHSTTASLWTVVLTLDCWPAQHLTQPHIAL